MSISFLHSRSFSPKRSAPAKGGFTLIELLVVSAIVLVITTFIFFQQGKFNSSTLLRSLTYSVALSIRQAQQYGVSVRGFTQSSGSVVFGYGYGVLFSAGDLTTYTLFADLNGNGVDDDSAELTPYKVGKGYTIAKFCATETGTGTLDCSDVGTISSLTVYFRRPNPDACFATSANPSACNSGATAVYSSAFVQLKSANGDTRAVKVSSTGQITVCAANLSNISTC